MRLNGVFGIIEPRRRYIFLYAVPFNYEKAEDLPFASYLPGTVNMPKHLMSALHPFRRCCRLSLGSFAFDHNHKIRGLDEYVWLRLTLEYVPVISVGVVAQESQCFEHSALRSLNPLTSLLSFSSI